MGTRYNVNIFGGGQSAALQTLTTTIEMNIMNEYYWRVFVWAAAEKEMRAYYTE